VSPSAEAGVVTIRRTTFMAPEVSLTETDAVLGKRIAIQQIDALFDTITASACGGVAAAIWW
jgi:hypothetical protein